MSTGFQPKSVGRAALLLLLLASIIAFRYGWFSRETHGSVTGNVEEPNASEAGKVYPVLNTDWNTKFAKAYKEAKTKAITKHVTSPPWYAAEYVKYLVENMGDTHSETILITPGHEFFDEISTCMTNGPISFGTVRALGEGRLELCPNASDQPGSSQCVVVCAIPWGQRQYLVGNAEVGGFISAIAAGLEPRNNGVGNFYMRKGDWEKPAEGKPLIPKSK